jgi:hypothetical protein
VPGRVSGGTTRGSRMQGGWRLGGELAGVVCGGGVVVIRVMTELHVERMPNGSGGGGGEGSSKERQERL